MKKILKISLLSIFLLLVLSTAGFFAWAETPSQPQQAALAALQSDDQVTVTDNGRYITFAPTAGQPEIGLIFYPGGHVDYKAYSPILHKIAAQGIFVALVPVRLNLAFFDIEAGAPVLQDFPNIKFWATGGHSLGGVASTNFAAAHPEIKAVVFWASYPADDRLRNSSVKMFSIYGTRDGGLQDGKTIEQYKAFQVPDTQFVVIEGGNHGQFGDYGPQPGDHPATISPEAQWQQTADATVEFLKSLFK